MGEWYDLVIVGMGSAGMVGAEFASGLGVKVAVVERGRVGGDCLWTGCVPSKALRASAAAADVMRHGDRFGLPSVEPEVDTAMVWKRIRSIQAEIAGTDDDPARFHDVGIDVILGEATITGPNTVAVRTPDGGTRELEPRFVLLATGSRPAVPPIGGLTEAGYLTSETLFELDRAPASIVVIGGGSWAIELAQALNRLGVRTTVLERAATILPKEEPTLVSIVDRLLRHEGVEIHTGVTIHRVEHAGGRKLVHVEGRAGGCADAGSDGPSDGPSEDPSDGPSEDSYVVEADEVLVATGRRPNIEGLGLEAIGIKTSARGVEVDERLRSTVPTIYAAGDVAGRFSFTHSAAYEAVRAVRDMFFPGKGKAGDAVPWCTFTDPELAHAGLTIAEAEAKHGEEVQVWRQDLVHSDRARADSTTDGAIIVITHKNKIVGAHILAPAAGEMIHELALAMREGVSLSGLAGLIHVYPTLATGIYQLAGEAAFEKAESFRWLVKKGKR